MMDENEKENKKEKRERILWFMLFNVEVELFGVLFYQTFF